MKELKHLNKYLYFYKNKLLVGLLITVIARVFSLIAPRLVGSSLTAIEKYLTDENLNISDVKNILIINIIIIITTSLLSGFFTFLMRQTIINVSRYIEFDLKNEIFWHYQKLNQVFYKRNRTGDLMNRISEDVSKVRMYFGPAIMYSINTITLFVVVISYMFSIAPKLTAYTIIPLPVLSIIIYKLSTIINDRSTLVQEMLSKISSFTQEQFTGIRVIKSYNLKMYVFNKFENITNDSYKHNLSLAKVQAWFFPLMVLLIGISNLIVIFIGGSQYISGEIEIGVLAEFIIYVNMLTWPVTVVGWITSTIQQAEASQKRINAFLKESPEIKDGIGVKKHIDGFIEFKNIKLQYLDTKITALKNVSFYVKKGETIGFVGKIGSGKTSILDLILRLYDPNEGRISLDGIDIKKFKLSELRSLIGYVPQNAFLFSENIEDNIKFGEINATNLEVEKAAKNACVHNNIIDFKDGYKTLVGERGVTLSGGQIQRISIARALIKKSKILILDDCLSAVDNETEKEILSNLKVLCENKTTIIVSHRVSSIKHADKILVIENGMIIQQGIHKELIKENGYYKELHKKQKTEKTN
jgi:ATP-binding cassette subfamily B multidrug efflux pump